MYNFYIGALFITHSLKTTQILFHLDSLKAIILNQTMGYYATS